MADETTKRGVAPGPSRQGEMAVENPAPAPYAAIPPHFFETAQGRDDVLPLLLFALTCLTTLLAGSYQEGGDPLRRPGDLMEGIPFALTLILILFVHEMGHYFTSKAYGVWTSLPYFIPGPWFPFGIGTFGAFIRIRSPIMKKAALLDIGAAGPFAGFIVAVAAIGVGLPFSRIVYGPERAVLLHLGDPLIFSWMVSLFGKVPAHGFILVLHPVAFAGWIGLFVTSLNLLPIGQLDGGHIAYALLGRGHQWLSRGMVVILVVLGYRGWGGWYLWAVMALLLGTSHPSALDETTPLDLRHRLRGIASLVLFIVTFMPVPIQVGQTVS